MAKRGFEAGPSAASLIAGLRDFGYTLETALADVIDNSISAGASKIDILADVGDDGTARIGVVDNGCGMDSSELRDAMRLASRGPAEARDATDLGRFGLGMKTASFSQCRRLTVVSRKKGATSAARWDLDIVTAKDRWHVQEPEPDTVPWVDAIPRRNGTLVLWEELDRVAGAADAETGRDAAAFTRRLSEVSSHLELVFHRFLSREGRNRAVKITLNERPLEPFDPFAMNNNATIRKPVEKVGTRSGEVTIEAFTLPHHSHYSSGDWDEWERLAGKDGYISNQGFYVYRARRLIVWGTWFGLARKSERTKLARVKIDLGNASDEEWKINVLKAAAQPPEAVRRKLRNLIDQILADSKRIYVHRGAKVASKAEIPLWQRIDARGSIRYEPNPQHPVLSAVMDDIDEEHRRSLRSALRLLAQTLPVDALVHDMSESPDKLKPQPIDIQELRDLVRTTATGLRQRNVPWSRIEQMMRSSAPFDAQWTDTEQELKQLQGERTK